MCIQDLENPDSLRCGSETSVSNQVRGNYSVAQRLSEEKLCHFDLLGASVNPLVTYTCKTTGIHSSSEHLLRNQLELKHRRRYSD